MERARTANLQSGEWIFAHADIQEIKKHDYDIAKLSLRLQVAVSVAAYAHEGQRRKLVDKPFLSHPFETMLMLGELLSIDAEDIVDGSADESLLIAALLHDAVEDSKGKVTMQDVYQLFGSNVAAKVDIATKEHGHSLESYLRKLRWCDSAQLDALRLVGADKIHALTCRIAELHEHEERAHSIEHFSVTLDEKVAYYRDILAILEDKLPPDDPILLEYDNLLSMYTKQIDFYSQQGVRL